MEKFEERLEYVIKKLGGIGKSAAICGKSPDQLKRYTRGAGVPFSVLKDLAVVADVSLDWLATGSESSAPEAVRFDPEEFLRLAVAAGDLSVRTPEEKEQLDAFRSLPPKEKLYIIKMMKAMIDAQKEDILGTVVKLMI